MAFPFVETFVSYKKALHVVGYSIIRCLMILLLIYAQGFFIDLSVYCIGGLLIDAKTNSPKRHQEIVQQTVRRFTNEILEAKRLISFKS